jgi:hypothetical protein
MICRIPTLAKRASRFAQVTVTGFAVACDGPGCPSVFVASGENLAVEVLATVIGDQMRTAGWSKDRNGSDLCPNCVPTVTRRARCLPDALTSLPIRQPSDVKNLPTIKDYAERLRALPPDLSEPDVLRPEMRLYADERVSIYFTPVSTPNPKGRVFFVGLTPGRYQYWLATMAAAALREGSTPLRASRAARVGAFAGSMRSNMVRMLDGIGLPEALGIESSDTLWTTDRHLMSATSAIRHAVILTATGANYSGAPKIERHPILNAFAEEVLARDIAAVPDALVIPLGKAVGDAVERLGLDPGRNLMGFPHPSGSNGHRARLYAERRRELATAVSAWAGG